MGNQSKSDIQGCTLSFECPQVWEALEITRKSDIRNCKICHKDVHLCLTLDEVMKAVDEGLCVAMPNDSNQHNIGYITRK